MDPIRRTRAESGLLQHVIIFTIELMGSVSSSVSGAGPSDSLDMQI